MAEDQAPQTRFRGKTEEMRIQSAIQVQVGVGILQRWGQQMTEDERRFMQISINFFLEPVAQQAGESRATASANEVGIEPASNKPNPKKGQ